MTKRFLIIANPIAGGGQGVLRARELGVALGRLGCIGQIHFTQRRGDARRYAAGALPDELDGVIAVGGDGTLNEVLNGLSDLRLPLGVLAMGTANVLSIELRLPRDPQALAALISRGHTTAVGVGLANGRRFLLFASSGMDGAMVQAVEAARVGTLGKLAWARPILTVVRRWQVADLRLISVEGQHHEGLSTVLVSRVRSYGGVFALPAGIAISDGYLHVVAFRQRSRVQYARAAVRGVLGMLRPGRDVIHFASRGLRIEPGSGTSADVPYQVDGDLGGKGAITISLAPETARLFCCGGDPPAVTRDHG